MSPWLSRWTTASEQDARGEHPTLWLLAHFHSHPPFLPLPNIQPGPGIPSAPLTAEQPMQLKRHHRIQVGECLYCGQTVHFISVCLDCPKGRAHQQQRGYWQCRNPCWTNPCPWINSFFPSFYVWEVWFSPLQALINSGAQDSLLNEELAMQARCSLELLPLRSLTRWSQSHLSLLVTIWNRFHSSLFQTLMVLGYPQIDWI